MIKPLLRTSMAFAVAAACVPAMATEGTADAFPAPANLNYHHMPGPDMAADGIAAPSGGGSDYLFVAGSAFTPRRSSITVTYPGGGCVNGSSDYLVTSLELPQGAQVSGVRLFYYNDGTSASANAALTSYTGDGGSNDLIFQTTTQNTGYVSEYFTPAAPPLVIDNGNQAYTLQASTGSGVRLCGMRVFYSP